MRNISSQSNAGGLLSRKSLKPPRARANVGSGGTLSAAQAITLGCFGHDQCWCTVQSGQTFGLYRLPTTKQRRHLCQTITVNGGLTNQSGGTVYADTITVNGTATNNSQLGATNSPLGSLNNGGTASATQTLTAGATTNTGSISANAVSLGSLSNLAQ